MEVEASFKKLIIKTKIKQDSRSEMKTSIT